jgi:hypothetical protein
MHIKVNLKNYLNECGITPYRLAKEVKGIGYATVYAAARGIRRPSLETLESILTALSSLTNKPVLLTDILQLTETPSPFYTDEINRNPYTEAEESQPIGLKGIRSKGGLVSDLVSEWR